MKQIMPVWGKDINRGYLFFSNLPGNILSEGITWLSNVEEEMEYGEALLDGGISHMGIIWDENWLIESAAHGVQFAPLWARINSPELRIVIREPLAMGPNYLHQLLTSAKADVGKVPYDFSGLVGYILKIISPFHHIFPFVNQLPVPLHVVGRFCSAWVAGKQMVTDDYKDLELFKKLHPTRISPNIFWNKFPMKKMHFEGSEKYESKAAIESKKIEAPWPVRLQESPI